MKAALITGINGQDGTLNGAHAAARVVTCATP